MHFLVIFGPPAVGKMTVGDALTDVTGIPVFHNHLSIEPVLRFFEFGSPPFARIVDGFRKKVIREVAASELPGLTFTFAWDLDHPADKDFLKSICQIFEEVDAEIALVELKADLDERLRRNRTPRRLAEKPSKRDVEWSERNLLHCESTYRMNSDGPLPLDYRHLVIDNTDRAPESVAAEIAEALAIPARPT